MTTTMDVSLASTSSGLGVAPSGRRVASLALAAAVLVAAGWAATFLSDVPADDVPLEAIRIGLVAVWGLVGGALAVRRPREPLGVLVLAGTLEALQNAGKHAGEGAVATVTIGRDAGANGRDVVTFTVADDGAGFDPAGSAGRGHGFVNMSDRLGAIGGTMAVDSAPGQGTRVSGTVPVDGQAGPAL